jgi:hypothetical protein
MVAIEVKKLKSNYLLTQQKLQNKWQQSYFQVAKGSTITSFTSKVPKKLKEDCHGCY